MWKCTRAGDSQDFVAVKFFQASEKSAIKSGHNELRILRMFFTDQGRTRSTLKEPPPSSSSSAAATRGASRSFSSERSSSGAGKKSGARSLATPESGDDCEYSDDYEYDDDKEDDDSAPLDLALYAAGLSSIARLLGHVEIAKRGLGIVYELCGATLTSQVWKMKGEFRKGERVYNVTQLPLWHDLFEVGTGDGGRTLLQQFLATCLEVLALLEDSGVMHADLKPDNILVDYDARAKRFRSIKVIDFGSAVYTERGAEAELPASTTPEYLAPEILGARSSSSSSARSSSSSSSSSSTTSSAATVVLRPDVWALGSVFLELAAGFPLWFPYKSRVTPRTGLKDFWTKGLLAVPSREPNAILRKQLGISRDVAGALRKCPGKGLSRNEQAMHLLSEMLCVDPERRVTAGHALRHPFLATRR